MKKIAIIGANSYIARNVLKVLKETKPRCNIMLYDFAEEHVDGQKEYESIKILDLESIKEIDMKCDIIFMFIGKTGSANGFDEFDMFIDVNEKGLLNLLNEYRRQGSHAKIIFPSTRLVYKGGTGSQKENAPKEFKTIYAINKYACEKYLEQYHRVFGIEYCIFRICLPYGTLIQNASSYGTAEFMLSKAMKGESICLYGEGSARRTLTYMKDLCLTLIEGAFSDKCCNDVFNIGGEDYSLKEMAELIAKKYNVQVHHINWPEIEWKIESGDTVFNDEKLKNCIGNLTQSRFIDWINRKL